MKKQILDKLIRTALVTLGIFLVTLTGAAFILPDSAYIHIGDAAVYLAALTMPVYMSVPAAAIGCMAADLVLGSANYALATVFIKAVTVAVIKGFLKLSENPLTQDILVSLSGAVTVGGYYIADVIYAMAGGKVFVEAMTASFDHVMYNVLQALICATVYMAVSGFVRKYVQNKKQKQAESAKQ